MFDVIILVLILISALFAFFRGFSLELLSISAWVISFFGSYTYGINFVNFLNKIINNILISTGISYVVTFLVIFVFFLFLLESFQFILRIVMLDLLIKVLVLFMES